MAVQAAGATAEPPPAASTRTLTALIGDAACDDDSQCRTLPVGTKACGGPEYYLAWSTKRTDDAALRQAAVSSLAPPRVDPRAMSTCVVVTDPGAHCALAVGEARGKSCQLRATSGAPGRVD